MQAGTMIPQHPWVRQAFPIQELEVSILLRLALGVIYVAYLASPGWAASPHIQTQVHMGTKFTISVDAPMSASLQEAMRSAFARIAKLDEILSDYRSESEVLTLSRGAPHAGPVPLSDDLHRVLQSAQALSKTTDGAFDVTVGPLTKLWRRARRRKQFPSAENLQRARQAVGFPQLKISPESAAARLTGENMRLDLGGIAKGYAADEALATLRKAGFPRSLINAGGDIRAGDAPRGKRGWKIGIAPLEANAAPSRFLWIANEAIATSGDAWQFVEIDGKRYSHILDPRTGIPLTLRSSVTVIASTGMAADSIASAVSVLGPTAGVALANQMDCVHALVVFLEGTTPRTIASRDFPVHAPDRD
mgnify:CR=1 FL=1